MWDTFGGFIQQNTANQDLFFFMQDSTDTYPNRNGKTGLAPTVTISKNGAAFGAPTGAVTEVANGYYKVAANATDSATLGELLLKATSAGAAGCFIRFQVVGFDPRDAVRLGLTALPNAVSGAAGSIVTSGTGANQISTSAGLVRLSATGVQDIWDFLLTGIAVVGSIGKKLKDWTLGTDNKVLISADGHTSGVTVQDVTNSIAVDTVTDKTGYALSAAALTAIENQIWNALTSAHTTSGTFGLKLGALADPWAVALPGAYGAGTAGNIVGNNLNATVSSRSTLVGSDIQTNVNVVLDATETELASLPADTASIRNKLKFLFQYFKFKRTCTNTLESAYKADGITTLGTTALSNDGTTFSKGKMS